MVDARTTAEWRKKGFVPIIGAEAEAGPEEAILGRLLSYRPPGSAAYGKEPPVADRNACPFGAGEMEAFLAAHPDHRMPLGLPPVTAEEHRVIVAWLTSGARGPDPEEIVRLTATAARDAPAWVPQLLGRSSCVDDSVRMAVAVENLRRYVTGDKMLSVVDVAKGY